MNDIASDDADRVATSTIPIRWPAVVPALVVLALAVPAFWPALVELAARWEEPGGGNSHGYAIVLLVPWLAWLARDRVSFANGRGVPEAVAAVALVLLLGTVYVLARAAHVELVAWSTVPPLLYAALVASYGWRGARVLAVPVAYLYFAIPIWTVLTPALQAATVTASSALVRAAGLAVFIDGDFVFAPAGTFEIAGGCAGTSFFVVALATAALFAIVERLRLGSAWRLCAAAAAMAIVLNWVRVAAIVLIGNATAMHSSLVEDHAMLGWWMFAAALVPLFLYARRLAAREPGPGVRRAAARVGARRAMTRLLPPLAALLATSAWAASTVDRSGAIPVLVAPDLRGWRQGPADAGWQPRFPGAAATVAATYGVPGASGAGPEAVAAYAAFYGRQRPLHELVGYPSGVDGDGWQLRAPEAARDRDGRPYVRAELAGANGTRRAIRFWYEVRGVRAVAAREVKWREALSAFGRPARSGVVALSAECRPNCDLAHETIGRAYDAGLARWSAGTALQ